MKFTRADVSDLTTFSTIARHRSFRRAALELGVSTSALSHSIRALEERLGVRLLNRTTRSVVPTEIGERLLSRLEPAFRDIAEALEEVNEARGEPAGTLRLNVPRLAAQFLLAPRMSEFLRRYPLIKLEIIAEDRLIDVVEGGYDAGIRFGDSLPKDMVAIPVSPEQRFLVVGSPEYFADHPRPLHPQDLRQHACVRWRLSLGGNYRWEFAKDGQALEMELDGPLVINDTQLNSQAALEGIGLAYCMETEVAEHLATGRLIAVLEDWCPTIPGFFLYYPSRRQVPAGLRALIELLRV